MTNEHLDPAFKRGSAPFTLPNKDVYEGEYVAHYSGLVWREGKGTYKTHDGQTYDGTWFEDKLAPEEQVSITYENGHKFYGKVKNNRYTGEGEYYLRDDLVVIGVYENSQPVGETFLIDKRNRLWYGISDPKENKCYFYMENYFFENITDDLGRGVPKFPQINIEKYMPPESQVAIDAKVEVEEEVKSNAEEPRPSSVVRIEEELTEAEIEMKIRQEKWERIKHLFDRTKEARIFHETKKTEVDIDFTKSRWYQNYKRFETIRETIMGKLETGGVSSLTCEEKEWCKEYKQFMNLQRLSAELRELKKNKLYIDPELKLMKKFWSKKFAKSCFPVPVYFPRKDWDVFFESPDFWDPEYKPSEIRYDDVFDSSVSSAEVLPILQRKEIAEKNLKETPSQTVPQMDTGEIVDFVKLIAEDANSRMMKNRKKMSKNVIYK